MPDEFQPKRLEVQAVAGGAAAAGGGMDEHKPKTPPPDLPSLLLDSRIVYLGMPVRELAALQMNRPVLPLVDHQGGFAGLA